MKKVLFGLFLMFGLMATAMGGHYGGGNAVFVGGGGYRTAFASVYAPQAFYAPVVQQIVAPVQQVIQYAPQQVLAASYAVPSYAVAPTYAAPVCAPQATYIQPSAAYADDQPAQVQQQVTYAAPAYAAPSYAVASTYAVAPSYAVGGYGAIASVNAYGVSYARNRVFVNTAFVGGNVAVFRNRVVAVNGRNAVVAVRNRGNAIVVQRGAFARPVVAVGGGFGRNNTVVAVGGGFGRGNNVVVAGGGGRSVSVRSGFFGTSVRVR